MAWHSIMARHSIMYSIYSSYPIMLHFCQLWNNGILQFKNHNHYRGQWYVLNLSKMAVFNWLYTWVLSEMKIRTRALKFYLPSPMLKLCAMNLVVYLST